MHNMHQQFSLDISSINLFFFQIDKKTSFSLNIHYIRHHFLYYNIHFIPKCQNEYTHCIFRYLITCIFKADHPKVSFL